MTKTRISHIELASALGEAILEDNIVIATKLINAGAPLDCVYYGNNTTALTSR